MGASVPASSSATPRETVATARVPQAKAALRSQEAASLLREIAKDAIRRVGKQSAAATEIGINEGRLAHKLSDGTISLGELEKLGVGYAAEFGRQLLERFGPLATPQARARQKVRDARQALDELDAYLEHVS